jgi:hypothetical protein
MKRTAAAIAVAALLTAGVAGATEKSAKPATPRQPCREITLPNGNKVLARPTAHGWSTLSCELQITVPLTDRVETFEVQPGVTSSRCTVWVNDKNGGAEHVVPDAWDACVSAMLEKAEAEGERRQP